MKSLSIIAVLICSLLISQFSFAQKSLQQKTIKVWGNCGMCKKTIEKSAKSAGAKTASWNEETKELKLTYSSPNISVEKIQKAIAAAGYDTQDFYASNKSYDQLHGCCKYERKEIVKSQGKYCCDNTDCKKDSANCKNIGCCNDETKACCKM